MVDVTHVQKSCPGKADVHERSLHSGKYLYYTAFVDVAYNPPFAFALQVNPALRIIRTSATNGKGMDEWLAWIDEGLARARQDRTSE